MFFRSLLAELMPGWFRRRTDVLRWRDRAARPSGR